MEDVNTAHSLSSSRLPAPLLEPKEPRAPIVILSPTQRKALIACLEGGNLNRHCGAWVSATAGNDEKRIAGITVAALARDGLLTINARGKHASARLTVRGSWFARTAADELTARGARVAHAH
jgi:hypothetical protein